MIVNQTTSQMAKNSRHPLATTALPCVSGEGKSSRYCGPTSAASPSSHQKIAVGATQHMGPDTTSGKDDDDDLYVLCV